MRSYKVAIIEDEVDLLEVMTAILNKKGYLTYGFESYEAFYPNFKKASYDIILSDKNLSGKSGIELVESIRGIDKKVPIFIITGRGSSQSTIEAYDLGADEYISKPFDYDVLDAKIKRALEKSTQRIKSELQFNDETFEVSNKNKSTKLTPHEFKILKTLFLKEGKLVTRDELQSDSSESSLDVHIFSLRKKLSKLKVEIQTIKGKGYSLKK